MTQKFIRNYTLTIDRADGFALVLKPPFTIEFDVTRKIFSSLNTGQIRIFNLSSTNRDLLRYDFSNYGGPYRKVILQAGYGDNLPIIFTGNITQAWSEREGINFVTTIESFDGGYDAVNGIIPASVNFPALSPIFTILQKIISYLPNTTLGAIGGSWITNPKTGQPALKSRYSVPTANALQALKDYTSPNAVYIDNGKVYVLASNEYVNGQVNTISSQSGLLNTPVREDNNVTFQMIFEPGVIPGQFINLETLTNPGLSSLAPSQNVNRSYKVVSVKHRGMISPAVCGDAITTMEFFYGPGPLVPASIQT